MHLPLDLDSLKSLSDELTKIATDAGTRAALAAKQGKANDYLVGGQLPSNTPTETNFMPKIGETDFRAKAHDFAEKHKGEAVSAAKGAGGAILLGQLLTGGRLGRHSGIARLGYRGFGGIGAGLGIADYHASKHTSSKKAVLPKSKTANMISSAFTPARQLSEGVQTGSFKKMIHAGGRLRPVRVGQKFELPSEPR